MEGEITAIREICDRVDGKAGATGPAESDNTLALVLAGLKVSLGAKLDRIVDAGATPPAEASEGPGRKAGFLVRCDMTLAIRVHTG